MKLKYENEQTNNKREKKGINPRKRKIFRRDKVAKSL